MPSRPDRRFGSVREVTFDLFRQWGVDAIFGNPGSTEVPMFRDFPDDFRYFLGLQESVVVGMADGYAQATGKAAVVNLHSAAGVGHALGNIYTAFRNQTPLVITAGQQARSILPFDAFLSADQAAEFPKPYVKYSIEPARAEDVPRALARAYEMAMQTPRGPVFVSIPVDDWDRETEFLSPREVVSTRYPDPGMIAEIAAALDGAERPALVVGAAVDRDNAWDQIISLAELQSSKVYIAPHANRCSFPEGHKLHAGFLPTAREKIVTMLGGHDVIVVIGAPAFVYHVEGDGPHIPPGSTLYQITESPDVASWTPTGNSLVADVRPAIEALLSVCKGSDRAAPEPRPEAPAAAANSEGVITGDLLFETLAAVRSPDTLLVEESPTNTGARQAYVKVNCPGSVFKGASGGLGFAMPAAVGVAIAQTDRRVIGILGDGSAMYSVQSLYSAAQLGLSLTFIIVNNRSYRAIEHFAGYFQMMGAPGTKLPSIDFVGIAEGMGVRGERVERPEDLEEALLRALSAEGPSLLEVIIA